MNSFDSPETAQRLLDAWKALKQGKLKFPPSLQSHADELLAAPLTVTGLVDTKCLSTETVLVAKSFGAALSIQRAEELNDKAHPPATAINEIQAELFTLFSSLFSALICRSVDLVKDEDEIIQRMKLRVKYQPDVFANSVNQAMDELGEFYNRHSANIYQQAKSFGGMRLVTGGQRHFGPSALNAVRITGLYADTQLIPDPIYPFLISDLDLNAVHLQLAIQLFHILQLRPLIDAKLPVPAVFIFPSFEEVLERNDAHTKLGIEQLAIRLISPFCHGQIQSLEELFEYSRKQETAFLDALMPSGLFVPPGAEPGIQLSASKAASQYLTALEGKRSLHILDQMKQMPVGMLLLNGVLERLRPQYHLFENSSELGAQALLSQPVHWHYFEKIAQTNARDLRSKNVISEQALQTLHAVQDDSLSWLANIPVTTLAQLISNNEHRWLREELNKYTSQLASTGAIDTNDMIKEVSHGLASLVQRQRKSLKDIESKYAPKKAAILTGGMLGAGLVASAVMLPLLSPLLAVGAPAVALAGVASGALIGFGKEKVGEVVEKHHAGKSMLGVLATTRPV
ncbi:hypothetical protein C4K10_2803 [Pseudomonas chlororaphis subsp. aureofaciens]|uniref:hypothetical protein n=1 Tax=Pseudomonas chlororaphis TaxID=587753 RepID=UPI000F583BDD|nr:hypothetical protein [Pseudomonas chlororaphis]AZE11083.1 hypothetical protein C4K10_2803 [Pseudomonas chlororaphis subsp. aureofaciens]